MASSPCICLRMAVSRIADAVWAVQLVSCLNVADKEERKAFSKILRKFADFMMIHNQPCQGHFASDNLLTLKVFQGHINSLEKSILVTGLPH